MEQFAQSCSFCWYY